MERSQSNIRIVESNKWPVAGGQDGKRGRAQFYLLSFHCLESLPTAHWSLATDHWSLFSSRGDKERGGIVGNTYSETTIMRKAGQSFDAGKIKAQSRSANLHSQSSF